MKHFFLSCPLLFLLLHAAPSSAQFQGNVYVEDSTIKVWANNHQNQLAWCGGFNNPQFAIADLNHDGKPDLTIYEGASGNNQVVRTFLNTGTAGNPNYSYQPKYALNFPPISSYLKLVDYNRDGIPDLITRGSDGFAIYKGKWNAQNELSFTFFKNLRFSKNSSIPTVNAYAEFIPGVADVDGDGDLDFLSYDVNGTIISFYKNCQVELGLPNDSIQICWPTACWGYTYQGYTRAFQLGIATGLSTPCDTTGTFSACKGTMHGGNNLCLLDIDGDGDMDLLNGNFLYSDIQLLVNGRIQNNIPRDSMVSQDTTWQTGGHMLDMPTFPAAFNVDVDWDGKKDLLISPQLGQGSENYKCIALYKNSGTLSAPVFTYQSDTFLVDHSIDAGTASYPLLYDYNKDGRLDLIVGSEGYFQPNGTLRSKLKYYQNTLVGGETRLVLQTDDLAGTFVQNFAGSAPAVGDLDGDGIDDLVLGHTDGTLSFYKNMAVSNSVTPQWQLTQLMMKNSNGDTIHVGYSATPFIYDLNKDGKPDLLIGYQNGGVFYFQNITATGSGVLSLQQSTNMLGGMNVNYMSPGFGGQSVPFVGKMDNTNKDYILLGTDRGVILRYDGFQSGNPNVAFNLIDSIYSNIRVGNRSSVTVGDIDKDGHYDMIVGNELGGLQLFRQPFSVDVANNADPFAGSIHCSLYPNPAKDVVYFSWDDAFSNTAPVTVRILSMTGQVVASSVFEGSAKVGTLSVKALPAGNYLGCISSGPRRFAAHFTTLK